MVVPKPLIQLTLVISTLLISNHFQYISNFKSPITYIIVKCGCLNYFFINYANLICRGTDISKYFIDFLEFEITGVDCI